jgi:hypothetical protein
VTASGVAFGYSGSAVNTAYYSTCGSSGETGWTSCGTQCTTVNAGGGYFHINYAYSFSYPICYNYYMARYDQNPCTTPVTGRACK